MPERYEKVDGKPLGHGAFGVVWRVRDNKLEGKLFAMKEVLAEHGADPTVLTQFRNEASALIHLEHNNIVRLHDLYDSPTGALALILEYVDGGTLAAALQEGGLTPHVAARRFLELAEGLAHAHGHQIAAPLPATAGAPVGQAPTRAGRRQYLHLDLKPANILLTADGTPKISDFGLAQLVADAPAHAGANCTGTPGYQAPEQALGQSDKYGPWTDVFGLGTILYEMLTGRPAVPIGQQDTPSTIRARTVADPIRPPRTLRGDIPKTLEAICLKCLAKSRRRRYPTTAALVEDLRCFLGARPTTARPLGSLGRAGLWCRRHPFLASAASVAVMVLLTCGVALHYRSEAQREQATSKEQEAKYEELRDKSDQFQLQERIAAYDSATVMLRMSRHDSSDPFARNAAAAAKPLLEALRTEANAGDRSAPTKIAILGAELANLEANPQQALALLPDEVLQRAETPSWASRGYQARGDAHVARGALPDRALAIAAFRKAHESNANPRLLLKIALCQFGLKPLSEAEATLTEVIKTAPEADTDVLALGYFLRSVLAGCRADFGSADKDMVEALKRIPANRLMKERLYLEAIVLHAEFGFAADDKERSEQSLADLRFVVNAIQMREFNRQEARLLARALCCLAVRLPEEAPKRLAAAKQALADAAVPPDDLAWADVWRAEGHCGVLSGHTREAMKPLTQAEALLAKAEPTANRPDVSYELGIVKVLLGKCNLASRRYAEAQQQLREARPLLEKCLPVGERKKLTAWFDCAINLADVGNKRAVAFLQQGAKVQMKEECHATCDLCQKIVEELSPDGAHGDRRGAVWLILAYATRSDTYLLLEQLKPAVADAEAALAAARQCPDALKKYPELGVILARQHIRVALSLAWTDAELAMHAIEIEQRLKDAEALAPAVLDDLAYSIRAGAAAAQGRIDEAIRWQSKAKEKAKGTPREQLHTERLERYQKMKAPGL